jgi:hypothetical protein
MGYSKGSTKGKIITMNTSAEKRKPKACLTNCQTKWTKLNQTDKGK